ncbi:MAG: hypothetical protein ACLSVD_03890 [Eggerthellaceae bacterium]
MSTESQLTALCVRKQNIYTEQRVFPYVEASDLRMVCFRHPNDGHGKTNPTPGTA